VSSRRMWITSSAIAATPTRRGQRHTRRLFCLMECPSCGRVDCLVSRHIETAISEVRAQFLVVGLAMPKHHLLRSAAPAGTGRRVRRTSHRDAARGVAGDGRGIDETGTGLDAARWDRVDLPSRARAASPRQANLVDDLPFVPLLWQKWRMRLRRSSSGSVSR
jgi:hypothetical protein